MAAILCFAASFAVYVWTAAAAPGWLDAPEFTAAAAGLGIPHPPGHPLPVLLGHALGLVPLGSWAFRVALASAAAGAVAVAGVCAAGQALLRRVTPELPAPLRAALSGVVSLGLGLTWAAWFQAVRPEVYALEFALLAWALAGALGPRPGDARDIAAVGLLIGLGLANHHFTTALMAIPLALWIVSHRPRLRALAWGVAATALGFCAYAQLVVRAAAAAWPNWGDPRTLGRLAWVISAKAFQKSLGGEHIDGPGADAAQALGALFEGLGVVPALVGMLGLYLLLRSAAHRRVGLLLLAILGITLLGRALLGFDDANPDAHGYLLPAFMALALVGLVAVGALADTLATAAPRTRALCGPVALLLMAAFTLTQGLGNAGAASLRNARASDEYVDALFDPLPPGALLVTSYFETTFLTWYATVVEARRPDVALLDRAQLSYPGNAAVTAARVPALRALIEAPLRVGAPTPLPALEAEATRRAIFFELHFTLEPTLDSRLLPQGLSARFLPEGRTGPVPPTSLPFLVTPSAADRSAATRVLLWHAFQQAEFFCRTRDQAAFSRALSTARSLAPGDLDLEALAARCQL